ncbi:hypothetical protein HZC00_02100 [Candidatus Kaiserbacteria bacterium]|nr:hypothetical protein [Candidatus Kaiserbacteria bacterium]
MEDQGFNRRMDEMEKKLDAVYESSEKMRKFFLWTVIAGVVAFVLPLIGIFFAIPSFISTYSNISNIGM